MADISFFSVTLVRKNKYNRLLLSAYEEELKSLLSAAYGNLRKGITSRALTVPDEKLPPKKEKKQRISILGSSCPSKGRFRRFLDFFTLRFSTYVITMNPALINADNRHRMVFVPPFLSLTKEPKRIDVPSIFASRPSKPFTVLFYSEDGSGENIVREIVRKNPDFHFYWAAPGIHTNFASINLQIVNPMSIEEVVSYASLSDAIFPLSKENDFPLSSFLAIHLHLPLVLENKSSFRSYFFDAPLYVSLTEATKPLRDLAFAKEIQEKHKELSKYLDSLYSSSYSRSAIETFLSKYRFIGKMNSEAN
ncbi:MAG: hypothetical protein SPG64_01640 [Candidatus Enteromonas sp.]|nr:hypothetical protein [Candidatus Enteromonas sp.]